MLGRSCCSAANATPKATANTKSGTSFSSVSADHTRALKRRPKSATPEKISAAVSWKRPATTSRRLEPELAAPGTGRAR